MIYGLLVGLLVVVIAAVAVLIVCEVAISREDEERIKDYWKNRAEREKENQ